MRSSKLPIATLDCETDPFKTDRAVRPFAWAFYNAEIYHVTKGRDCTEKMVEFLMQLEPHQIFAHNGGKFDFMFLLSHLRGKPLVINNRIVDCDLGPHMLSDSYARVPVALAKFGGKIEIEYWKLEAEHRHKHMPEILAYLRQDCIALYDVISTWLERFGRSSSTMASAAFKTCQKNLGVKPAQYNRTQKMSEQKDAEMRPYYYGGRVQAFAHGIVQDNIKMHDVNSMYPYVMCEFNHPVGNDACWTYGKELGDYTHFAKVTGWSKGALPMRTDQGLAFPSCYGTFDATIHEIKAGIETGRFKLDRVELAYNCKEQQNFREFIEPIYKERLEARLRGYIMDAEFLKLVMNSTYGKYAINPRTFKDFAMISADEAVLLPRVIGPHGETLLRMDDKEWAVHTIQENTITLVKPSEKRDGFKNVTTAASITGAARSVLLRALAASERPYYCDTDCIAGRVLGVASDATALGAWKLEATGDEMALAGKKMYALYGNPENDATAQKRIKAYGDARCIKLASKGVRLTSAQMRAVAQGSTITHTNAAPSFAWDGSYSFIKRRVHITNPHLIAPFPDAINNRDIHGGLERWSA